MCELTWRSPAAQKQAGYSGSYVTDSQHKLSNTYFKVLLSNTWKAQKSAAGKPEFRAAAPSGAKTPNTKIQTEQGAQSYVYMTPTDLVIREDPALAAIAKEYAGDEARFVKDFAAAWTKAMNADRFQGPVGNVCYAPGANV